MERETVHEIPIYEECVSMVVYKNEDDEYILFKSVEMDDPPMRKIGEVVRNFILWPTKFLRHPYVQL